MQCCMQIYAYKCIAFFGTIVSVTAVVIIDNINIIIIIIIINKITRYGLLLVLLTLVTQYKFVPFLSFRKGTICIFPYPVLCDCTGPRGKKRVTIYTMVSGYNCTRDKLAQHYAYNCMRDMHTHTPAEKS